MHQQYINLRTGSGCREANGCGECVLGDAEGSCELGYFQVFENFAFGAIRPSEKT